MEDDHRPLTVTRHHWDGFDLSGRVGNRAVGGQRPPANNDASCAAAVPPAEQQAVGYRAAVQCQATQASRTQRPVNCEPRCRPFGTSLGTACSGGGGGPIHSVVALCYDANVLVKFSLNNASRKPMRY